MAVTHGGYMVHHVFVGETRACEVTFINLIRHCTKYSVLDHVMIGTIFTNDLLAISVHSSRLVVMG